MQTNNCDEKRVEGKKAWQEKNKVLLLFCFQSMSISAASCLYNGCMKQLRFVCLPIYQFVVCNTNKEWCVHIDTHYHQSWRWQYMIESAASDIFDIVQND